MNASLWLLVESAITCSPFRPRPGGFLRCPSERHRNHKYRYSHEVAPEIKAQLMQSVSDTKLKRNGLEESRQLLSTKLQEVNVYEKKVTHFHL